MQIKIITEKCTGCGLCPSSCTVEALTFTGTRAVIDATRCIKCRMCLTACPEKAIVMR